MLFNRTITNWDDWARVYQSIPAFESIVQEILVREQLPIFKIEHLTPGTNAVFRAGDIVVKIYAPAESGMDQVVDHYNYGDYVLVHGDLCGGNVLVTDALIPIDYADAVLAPTCYEHSLVFFEYQAYPHFLKGYFAEAEPLELAQDVFNGILIHDFGGDIVRHAFGSIHNFKNLDVLRREIDLRAECLLMLLWE